MESSAFIALGSNLNLDGVSSLELIKKAIIELEKSNFNLQAISRFFKNPAFPIGSGPDFVNAVVKVRIDAKPQNILDQLHSIEKKFGRSRGKRWDGRTLDLDLLAVGQSIQPSNSTYLYWHDLDLENQLNKIPSNLILPHPRMHERAFVLVPLLDIAPRWIHPVLKKNISELCNDLSVEEISDLTCL